MKDLTPYRRRRSPLIAGLILIAIGVVLLCMNLGYRIPLAMWQFYPGVLIALGLLGIVAPSRHLSRSGGIWLLAAGMYCAIGEFSLFDLGWGSAWPIFIIAYGIEVVFGARGTRGPWRRDRADGDDSERGKHEA
ncbi:MAG TPA: DUF5668 domain-containing protein [Steroidobacteraceae bacterium]|jgi:hypothetical protein